MLYNNIHTINEENIDKNLLNELLNDFNENINNNNNVDNNIMTLNKLLHNSFTQIKNSKDDTLQLYYQPIFDIQIRKPIAVEALLRWSCPNNNQQDNNKNINKQKYYSPKKIIHIAEQSNLINDIGEWILKSVCQKVSYWKKIYQNSWNSVENSNHFKLSVNISPKQILQNDFCEMVAAIFAENDVDTNLLEFEFSESTLMQDYENNLIVLKKLKQMGISLAIDNFAGENLPLSKLLHCPTQSVKIDKQIIKNLNNINKNENTFAFCNGIINLCKALQLNVIAKGVENAKQFEILKDLKCQQVQGFFLATPMSCENIEKIFN